MPSRPRQQPVVAPLLLVAVANPRRPPPHNPRRRRPRLRRRNREREGRNKLDCISIERLSLLLLGVIYEILFRALSRVNDNISATTARQSSLPGSKIDQSTTKFAPKWHLTC